jgi:hypothetical protein
MFIIVNTDNDAIFVGERNDVHYGRITRDWQLAQPEQ